MDERSRIMANQALVNLGINSNKKVNKLNLDNPINFLENQLQQLKTLNNAPIGDSPNKIISQLFEECVEKYGDRTAVSSHSGAITYSELNAKANQLANYLRKNGVGRNSLVAIYLERSVELIISILGVVKAGGIFLPLSTDDPNNRIRRILQDSTPAKIISTTDLHKTIICALSQHSETNIIPINKFFDEKIELDSQNPVPVNVPSDPIYIMYTSGSTGKPKGCIIPHHGVARVVKDTNYIQINESDIIAQIANSAFDAMTFEMWGALLNGASLHVFPQLTLFSPIEFTQTLKQNNISILCITASLLNIMVKSCPYAFDNLRYLLFVGEKANPEIIKILLNRKLKYNLTRLNLINGYGPTECTTFTATFAVKKMSDIEKTVPIGKPITDTTTYVLDENLQFVPAGVIGELYIGGKGIALGYLNDSKQTIQKFISSPCDPSEKIYRTGDLVYFLPDIGLIYVGRVDAQVKINGFRVEPTEIEAVIVKNRAVKQAVVVSQTDSEGRKKLMAYICFHRNENVDFVKFHQYLRDNIPHYMMPSKTFEVDYIPLTNNGKTDVNALEKMQVKNILEDDTFNLPSNNVEKVLIEVWQQLLGVSYINTSQNIFDLGAHSLMLCEACALINAKLNIPASNAINIINLLSYPTIRQLSDYINKCEKSKSNLLNSPIVRATFQRRILMARKGMHAVRS